VFTPSKYDENVSRRVARDANFRINNLKPSTRLIKDFGVSTIAIEVSIYSLAEINRTANLFQVITMRFVDSLAGILFSIFR